MTSEQFNDLVREAWESHRYRLRSPHHHHRFEWDRKTGYSHDMVCYGPFDCSSSTWIVPGSIEESEYDIDYDDFDYDDLRERDDE